jgi:hypothetical protein
MEEEKNKKAEARRVLDAIRKKDEHGKPEEKPNPEKPMQWLVSADAAQLQALVEQSRGIRKEIEARAHLPDPESIDTISVEQIKVLRQAEATTKGKKEPLARYIYGALIRAYFESIEFFKASGRAKRCLTEGHQCLHCGEKFQAAPFSALNSPESSAQQSTEHPKP